MSTARKENSKLWEKTGYYRRQGGRPGQWSAQKAQLAVAMYKKAVVHTLEKKKKTMPCKNGPKKIGIILENPKKAVIFQKK